MVNNMVKLNLEESLLLHLVIAQVQNIFTLRGETVNESILINRVTSRRSRMGNGRKYLEWLRFNTIHVVNTIRSS